MKVNSLRAKYTTTDVSKIRIKIMIYFFEAIKIMMLEAKTEERRNNEGYKSKRDFIFSNVI